jgi:subtilase family serine protease
MRRRPCQRHRAVAAALIAVFAVQGGVTVAASAAPRTAASRAASQGGRLRPACPVPPPGQARCYVLFAPQTAVNAAIAAGRPARPQGLSPRDVQQAYRLPVARGHGQTVAVVEAYNTAHLAQWLSVYRRQYHLPACTQASGCLRIVNQQGKPSPLPSSHLAVYYGWDVEASLDVSMVSAACPRCRILVVEARTQGFENLAAAEDTAARLGAGVISNSYGGQEYAGTQVFARHYDHPGHVIVASAGDIGFTQAGFPANLSTVTAIGGTVLTRAHNTRGWAERVWNNGAGAGGSACSAYVAKPPWQHDPHCLGRTIADLAAVAWNIPIYDSHYGGWLSAGGTSAGSPLVAGVYALAGNTTTFKPGQEYQHPHGFFDVTSGNNAWIANGIPPWVLCGGDYLCTAKPGYDAPTGLGTPNGTSGF